MALRLSSTMASTVRRRLRLSLFSPSRGEKPSLLGSFYPDPLSVGPSPALWTPPPMSPSPPLSVEALRTRIRRGGRRASLGSRSLSLEASPRRSDPGLSQLRGRMPS
uniref:Uncharacterized protein n=1 Tax=Opuntia streptacantha TaxID=393608 RepID=A0A7C9D002_OPUST